MSLVAHTLPMSLLFFTVSPWHKMAFLLVVTSVSGRIAMHRLWRNAFGLEGERRYVMPSVFSYGPAVSVAAKSIGGSGLSSSITTANSNQNRTPRHEKTLFLNPPSCAGFDGGSRLVGAQVAGIAEGKPLETVNGLSFQRGGRIIHNPERALEMLQSWEVTKRRLREGVEFFHLRRPREDAA